MGIPKVIASPDTVFVRKFRWIVSADHFSETAVFRSVKVSCLKKQIELNAHEIIIKKDNQWEDISIFHWLKHITPEEKLTFTTYDGCGQPLYSCVYSGLELLGADMSFDYGSSDVSTLDIVLSYKEVERKCLYNPGPTRQFTDLASKGGLTDEVRG